MKRKVLKMLVKAVLFYSLFLAGLYLFQRHLMYYPDRNLFAPEQYQLTAQKAGIETADDVTLAGWYWPAQEDQPTLLHLHGNAGNISNRIPVYQAFAQAGFGVLGLEWRGYGTSEGKPSEPGFYEDARAGMQFLKDQGVDSDQVMIYGESIGSGPAVQLATEVKAKALILEAPFTSLANRAAEIYWYVPAKYMVKDRYDSIAKIKRVNEPLMIFHNRGDQVVPVHHGEALHAAANEPKKLLLRDANYHVAFDREWQVEEVKAFLAEVSP